MTSTAPVRSVAGDRFCSRCGYNLIGQPITRESHYDMLMLRCTECGHVTSIEEHPNHSRWSRYLAFLTAAGVMIFGLALILATAGIIAGFSALTGAIASSRLSSQIFQAYQEVRTQPVSEGMAPPSFDEWWAQRTVMEQFEAHGGFARVDWSSLLAWTMLIPAAFLLGVILSVAFANLKARGQLFFAAAITFVSLLFNLPYTISLFVVTNSSDRGSIFGLPFTATSLLVGGVSLAIGLFIGRRIGRRCIAFILPPHAAVWLNPLWEVDGLRRLPRN